MVKLLTLKKRSIVFVLYLVFHRTQDKPIVTVPTFEVCIKSIPKQKIFRIRQSYEMRNNINNDVFRKVYHHFRVKVDFGVVRQTNDNKLIYGYWTLK